MKKEIEEKVKAYYEAKVALDFQKAQLESLAKELKEELQQEGVKKEITSNGYEVSLTSRTTIKYNDELALKDSNSSFENPITFFTTLLLNSLEIAADNLLIKKELQTVIITAKIVIPSIFNPVLTI